MKRLSFIAAALLCFVTAVSAAIRPAQPGIGGGGSSGGSVNATNAARFAYGYRTGPVAIAARTNVISYATQTVTSNFLYNGVGVFSNLTAGYYEISGGFNYYAVSNDTIKILIATNGVMADNLIAYSTYESTAGGGALGTNFVHISGMVYLPAVSAIASYIDYAESIAQTLNYQGAHLIIRPIDSASASATTGATGATGATGPAGGVSETNANQFGASTTLTIKDGPLVTNAVFYGTISNIQASAFYRASGSAFAGFDAQISDSLIGLSTVNGLTTTNTLGSRLNIRDGIGIHTTLSATGAVFQSDIYSKSNITAGSFIGSGTGTPILKLQTMMSADNAFAITVATNRTATTTNIFDFTNVVAAQVISAHSSSAGQVVWTNATAAAGGASVAFSAVPTALSSVSNYAKQLMFQSMKPNASTSLDRQSAESPNTQGGAELPPVNASLPIGLSATNHTGLYGWFPSSDLFHYSTRDHVSTFLVSFVGQTSSNRTWIGLSGAAAIYNTDVPGTPTYGFRHSSVVADNNWVCYSADGTRTVSNLVTTGSITTNVLYALATVKTGTNVIFYIDGAPKFTNHFDPAGAIMGYRIIGSKAGATGARSGINLHDYFSTTTIP